MIELVEVRKAFNQGKHNEFWALDGINLSIEAHRVTALCGPSGSGKTTLLTLIGCLARPTSGRARFKGEDISGLPERFLTQLRRRSFGFVFQQFNLIRGLSAEENVMLPAAPSGLPQRVVRARAAMLLERLRLAHRRTARVEWLSGGEQQRVAIARALINDPEVLIADEPTANLDTTLAREFLAILESFASEGRTVILSSHDPLVIQSAAVHRVINMRDGRIVSEPPPENLAALGSPPPGGQETLGAAQRVS